jgi:hypothetical protein
MAYIGRTPVVGNFVKLDAITTSATATYNLLNGGVAYFPQTANNCIVSLNGVIQSPTSAYTISGSTIVFSDALTSNDSIDFILVLGDVLNIGTPSDGTVSFAKVTSNLITGATAETSIDGADSVLIYDDSASALRKMTRTNFVSGLSVANTPAFRAKLTSAQSIVHNTAVLLAFATEEFDTDSAFDNVTNYRFTVPSGKAGKYCFQINLRADNFTTARENVAIRKNGSEFAGFENGNGSVYDSMGGSVLIDLAVGDYIDAIFYQASGVTASVLNETYFSGFKLI